MLERFHKVLFWVGAGLSQASGVSRPPAHDRLAFVQHPEKVWTDYLNWRQTVLECAPNAAHHWLRRLQLQHPWARIVTLNIDGLLQRAECQVLELHGTVWESRCFGCGQSKCSCRGRQRPAVVWPGEDLPARAVEQALDWLRECDCLVSVGTSARQAPADQMPLQAKNAYRIEINPNETALSSHHDECWRGPAETLLERLAPSGSR